MLLLVLLLVLRMLVRIQLAGLLLFLLPLPLLLLHLLRQAHQAVQHLLPALGALAGLLPCRVPNLLLGPLLVLLPVRTAIRYG